MSGEELDTFHAPFFCSPEIGELPAGLRGTIIIIIFIIRVPFPALSRDVACRVSPLAPVCYQYLFRVPIPAGDETRHATRLSQEKFNFYF